MTNVGKSPLEDLHEIRERSAKEMEGLTLPEQVRLINERARRIEDEYSICLRKYLADSVVPAPVSPTTETTGGKRVRRQR